ncbi:hypothetical protein N7540_004802 [Penicillium herquei]|nr:hypothetical protein N7540_004802 [Penicillium herquei]
MDGPDPQQLHGRLEGLASEATADKKPTQLTVLHLPHAIPLLILNDGDTLLYIDPAPGQLPRLASKSKSTIPLRVRSSTLLGTRSQYLAKFFEESYQKRIRRKRGFVDSLPPGIKFLVDLTPAIVEEDAVIALTEISCPKGIRAWAGYQDIWKLPAICVGGVDELEMTQQPQRLVSELWPEPFMKNEKNESFGQRGPDDKMLASLAQKGVPVEYSASRHRDGIEWVLHVLEGLSIVLDTPCKMWTFFAIAKIFEVANHPAISGYILSWFYEGNNTRFIEIYPDISHRVACGIQSNVLCRHAFAGLVADEAAVYLIRSANLPSFDKGASSFQKSRILDLLSDTDIQRIEYASKAFTDDILKHFLHLVGKDMVWLKEIPEFQKLLAHTSEFPQDEEMVRDLIELIKQDIRFRLCHSLHISKDPERVTDTTCLGRNPDPDSFQPQDMIIKAMGKDFWTVLGYQQFELPVIPDKAYPTNLSLAEIGHGLLPFSLETDVPTGHVDLELLKDQITAFNIRAQDRIEFAQDSEKKSTSKQHTALPTDSLSMRPRVSGLSSILHSTANDSVHDSASTASDPARSWPPGTSLPLRPANPANTDSQTQPLPSSTPATDVPNAPATGSETQLTVPVFNLHKFTQLVEVYISTYASSLLSTHEQVPLERRATDLLTCLTDNQWKYLPLWAGGNDDGTGGVFTDEEIPNVSSEEFLGPGPAIGTSAGSTHSRSESFKHVDPSDYNTTVCQASRNATYSHRSDIQSMDEREWISAGARFYQNGFNHRPGQGYKQVLLPEPDYGNFVDYDYCPMTIAYDGSTDESADLCAGVRATARTSSNHDDDPGDDHNMEICDDDFEML